MKTNSPELILRSILFNAARSPWDLVPYTTVTCFNSIKTENQSRSYDFNCATNGTSYRLHSSKETRKQQFPMHNFTVNLTSLGRNCQRSQIVSAFNDNDVMSGNYFLASSCCICCAIVLNRSGTFFALRTYWT